MAILQESDFASGEYCISTNRHDNDLAEYITTYEKHFLLRLLGAELYGLFIADLTAPTPQVPQTQRFIDIFDPFEIDDNSCLHISEGIKEMLKQFVYFYYNRDKAFYNSASGFVRNDNENATNLNYNAPKLVNVYNEGINNYKEIQWYICDNDETYPEENTQILGPISGI